MPLDVQVIRRQFPALAQRMNGHPLIYLDNAATTQKPRAVLEAMERFYEEGCGNAHRGMHPLAERATIALEGARAAVAALIGAEHPEEIIVTKSCTEAINLVAKTWGHAHLKRGDSVVLSLLEHHSNIVPWLQLKEERGISIEWIDSDDDGNLRLEQLDGFLRKGNAKLVAITAKSNVLGTRPPMNEIITKAHASGALVLVDAAQAVAHFQFSILNSQFPPDFLAFSAHKLYGPTGIGILYGKRSLLESMPPFLGGGHMIRDVRRDRFSVAEIPAKFEAGTMPIAEAVGLRAAIEWLGQFEWKDIESHEQHLLQIAAEELQHIEGLIILPKSQVLSPKSSRNGCLSFTIEGIHPHDLTEVLGQKGFCLRAGHHCTQPLHDRLGITASTRLSVALYNTEEEIRMLRPAIEEAKKILQS